MSEQREILFRGKRMDNGEWVYGGFSKIDGHFYIVQMIKYRPDTRDYDLANYYEEHQKIKANLLEVYPTTVGQYTGLLDKNGKRIFEDDIIRIEQFDARRGLFKYIGFVKYEKCKFIITKESVQLSSFLESEIKVMGNIHDNPELLEVTGDGA